LRITFVDSVFLFSLNSILNPTHPRKGDCMRSLKQYLCVPVFFVSLVSMVFSAKAATYYVNLTHPSGHYTGKDTADPWNNIDSVNTHVFNAGDSILWARGTMDTARPSDSFMPAYENAHKSYKKIYGFVCPQGNGSPGKPIVMSAYGLSSLPRPIISAKGHDRTAAILLYDQNYWTIQNIEVRNCSRRYDWHDSGYSQSKIFDVPNAATRDSFVNFRWGIFVYDDDGNVHNNITISHITADSVFGSDRAGFGLYGLSPWWAQQWVNMGSNGGGNFAMDYLVGAWAVAGIMIKTDGPAWNYDGGGNPPTGFVTDGPTSVNSVLIDSNNVHDIFGEGIIVGNDSLGSNGPFDLNVSIIGDTVLRTAEIAVHLTGMTDSAIISGNIIDSAGFGVNQANLLSGSRAISGYAGIEIDFQKNSIIQYNSISNTQQAVHPCWDGEAIDFDQNNPNPPPSDPPGTEIPALFSPGHVYVQYNYSCNNQNAFFTTGLGGPELTDTGADTTTAIVRYNISQNDGIGGTMMSPQSIFQLAGDDSINFVWALSPLAHPICYYRGGNQIYNNVFYNVDGIRLWVYPDTVHQKTSYFDNNIFISPYNDNSHDFFMWDSLSICPAVFSHNCYWDLLQNPQFYQTTTDPAPIYANPNIKNPGNAVGGFLMNGGDSNEIASAKACYLLNAPTPCLESGIKVTGSIQDFWGTPVSTFPYPDVGAYETPTVEMQVIPLDTGWNMNSFNVVPPHDTTTAVFGTDPTGFLLAKDNAGDLYCPYWGQDNLHYVQVGQGYKIYISPIPDTLRVQGLPVNYAQTPIALSSGWNMIAYLPQTDDSITHALASIKSLINVVENNSGNIYEPSQGINNIGVMHVGQGYQVLMDSARSLTYPTPDKGVAKEVALSGSQPMLDLPKPRHYAIHAPTGCNDVILPKQVTIGGKLVPDLSEIGAFDASGSLVGSGTILKGVAAFVVWGQNPMTKQKDGLAAGEPVTFKLWDGSSEYPLEFQSQNGTEVAYKAGAIFQGQMIVSGSGLIKAFDLTQAYPNPFRGSVKISFDVPSIVGTSQQAIEINVYDLKGSLVKQLASGKYQAGHYTVAWNCTEGRATSMGSSVYIVRMKATNFDKRLKLLRVQ